MILIDTSVLSRAFRRRRAGAQEEHVRDLLEGMIADDVTIGLPGVVLQEILSGLRSEKQFVELERRLVHAFSIIHATTTDYIEAARLRNLCIARGLNVSGPDCLIARVAIAGHHELFAIDEDFQAIARHSSLALYRTG